MALLKYKKTCVESQEDSSFTLRSPAGQPKEKQIEKDKQNVDKTNNSNDKLQQQRNIRTVIKELQWTALWAFDELESLHAARTINYMFWAIIEAEGQVGIP